MTENNVLSENAEVEAAPLPRRTRYYIKGGITVGMHSHYSLWKGYLGTMTLRQLLEDLNWHNAKDGEFSKVFFNNNLLADTNLDEVLDVDHFALADNGALVVARFNIRPTRKCITSSATVLLVSTDDTHPVVVEEPETQYPVFEAIRKAS